MISPAKSKPVLKLKAFRTPTEPVPAQPPLPPPKPVAEPVASKKAAHKIAIANMRRDLFLRFPAAFKGWSSPKPPLKVGIFADILERAPDLDVRVLKHVMASYFHSNYYTFIVEGSERVDLDGKPCGVVTAEEARHAAQMLQAKKKAQ
jgi:ProP effector